MTIYRKIRAVVPRNLMKVDGETLLNAFETIQCSSTGPGYGIEAQVTAYTEDGPEYLLSLIQVNSVQESHFAMRQEAAFWHRVLNDVDPRKADLWAKRYVKSIYTLRRNEFSPYTGRRLPQYKTTPSAKPEAEKHQP